MVRWSGVKHFDETGFRMAGRGQWLQVLSTAQLTDSRISPSEAGSGPMHGSLVHDHWALDRTAPGGLHALCNAQHLRELEAWAVPMQRLLRLAQRGLERACQRQRAPASVAVGAPGGPLR